MKKRKLLCLLMAALSLTVPFSACDDKEDGSVQPVTEHEIWSNFVMDEEKAPYSQVYKIDGTVKAYDEAHNLIVLETKDLSTENIVTTKYTVYDLSDGDKGKVLFEKTVRNLYNEKHATTLNVALAYPLIEVVETNYYNDYNTADPDDKEKETKYSYYLIKKDKGYIDEDDKLVGNIKKTTSPLTTRTVENLYVCEIDEKVYWINQDAEVLRTLNKMATDSYYLNLSFNAEFNDYLYSWSTDFSGGTLTRAIQVFNKEGVCSMQYNYPADVMQAEVFVLNDGNIFVQEQRILPATADEYDYKLMGQKVDLASKVVNFKTGEVKELDLNYMVTQLESRYTAMGKENSAFSLQLKEGQENQAYIQYYNESGTANRTNYVVLDNQMNVQYTVKNDTLDLLQDHDIELLSKDYYKSYTIVNGIAGDYMFDMDGNLITKLPDNLIDITSNYIVTTHAIYDYNMNLVYDVEASMFGSNRGNSYECEVLGDKIFMYAENYLTGAKQETYIFDNEKKEPVLFSDGLKTEIDVEDDVYIVEDFVNDTIALYDEANNLLVKVQGADVDYYDITTMEDVMFVELAVDGKDVCYVIRRA